MYVYYYMKMEKKCHMIKQIKRYLEKYLEIILYLFWGGLTTVVNWGSYSLCILLLNKYNGLYFSIAEVKFSGTIVIANLISWVCAVLFAFITNKLWVFNSKSWNAKIAFPEFVKFVSTRLITGGMEMIAVPLLVALGVDQVLFGIDGGVAKVIVSIIVVLLNYISSKLFIFK